jgi:hypothetical protein
MGYGQMSLLGGGSETEIGYSYPDFGGTANPIKGVMEKGR